MTLGLCCAYSMRQIVFLSLLAICSAELGYQYQQPETDLGIKYGGQPTTDHYQDHAGFHKHFYAFEAPYDSAEEVDHVEHKIAANSQKNLQVVFIKAPENKAVQGALNALVKQTTEDKTAIYVLNKQTDSNELASKITAIQTLRKHKPQVHFVKYRTDAEAAYAQQHIQAQYGRTTGQTSQHLQPQSVGYSQQPELSQPPQGYFPPELPQQPQIPLLSQQGYLTEKQPPQGYFPPELSRQPQLQQQGYLPEKQPAQAYFPPELPQSPQLSQQDYLPEKQPPQGYFGPELPQQPQLPQQGYLSQKQPTQGYFPAELPHQPQIPLLPQQGYLSEKQHSQGYFPAELPQQPQLSQQGYIPEKQPPQGYYPTELPQLPQQGYFPKKPPQGPYPPELPPSGYSQQPLQGLYPQESTQFLPTPAPSYLPPAANYAGSYQGYNYGVDQGKAELPPLPLEQQQLSSNPYDLDARTARSRRIDFRVNERHRPDSRMVFPTETSSKRYLPVGSNTYLPAQKRKRRAHF